MYARGGIFSITSRILVVDLLSSTGNVYGSMVHNTDFCRASEPRDRDRFDCAACRKVLFAYSIELCSILISVRVIATAIEAFIVRIYRQMNKVGFLKAFSDNPEPLTTGFAPLAAMMRNLFLRKPSLWPRFHVTVAKSLEGRKKAEVIELEVPMTESMKDIQNAILECVEVSISELKKAGTGLELDDWNLDSALHKSFDVIIRRQLNPILHRVSFRTRQIVNDLTVLRSILQYVREISDNQDADTSSVRFSPMMRSPSTSIWIPYWQHINHHQGQRDKISHLGFSWMLQTPSSRQPNAECTREGQRMEMLQALLPPYRSR